MDRINFTGGFLIKSPTPAKWKKIEEVLPKHKIILPKYNDSDVFVAVKPCYDPQIASQILAKKINFKFYPNINLKTRLDAHNMDEAYKIIGAQTEEISTFADLRQYIKSLKKPFRIPKYNWKPEDHIPKTFKVLGLEQENYVVKIKNGITIIKDKNGKLIAKASPNTDKGTNFIYVYPKNSDDSSKKLAVASEGEIFEFSPLQYMDFKKQFMRAVKIDNARKRPQK